MPIYNTIQLGFGDSPVCCHVRVNLSVSITHGYVSDLQKFNFREDVGVFMLCQLKQIGLLVENCNTRMIQDRPTAAAFI